MNINLSHELNKNEINEQKNKSNSNKRCYQKFTSISGLVRVVFRQNAQ